MYSVESTEFDDILTTGDQNKEKYTYIILILYIIIVLLIFLSPTFSLHAKETQ